MGGLDCEGRLELSAVGSSVAGVMLAGGRQGRSVTLDVSGGVGRPGVQSLPWAFTLAR